MALSFRRFLVAPDGNLYRLRNAKFDRMLREPKAPVLSAFAGQRVRMADLVVELAGRVPLRVVRSMFAVLPFDADGRMDSDRFLKQQWARAETALDRGLCPPDSQDSVLDAAVRFVAHGGAWKPSNALARALEDAALGRTACRRAYLSLRSTQGLYRTVVGNAMAHHYGELLLLVVSATIVVSKAMRDNDEDL